MLQDKVARREAGASKAAFLSWSLGMSNEL